MSASIVFAGEVRGVPEVEGIEELLPENCESLSGESDLLSIINGGAAACRVRPQKYPEVISAEEINSREIARSRRKRRAQGLQKRRLVQKCQRKRISLLPHWQQKFGLYTVQFSALILKRLA